MKLFVLYYILVSNCSHLLICTHFTELLNYFCLIWLYRLVNTRNQNKYFDHNITTRLFDEFFQTKASTRLHVRIFSITVYKATCRSVRSRCLLHSCLLFPLSSVFFRLPLSDSVICHRLLCMVVSVNPTNSQSFTPSD